MSLPLFIVDAFTDQPYRGNPAAICLLEKPMDASWMQDVAREMNLSETAFLLKEKETFHLRWFTPATEVELCGHATLAGAHILWEQKILKASTRAVFQTASGNLSATLRSEGITLDFPTEKASQAEAPPGLEKILGVRLKAVLKNRMDYVVEVETEKELRALKPNFAELAKVPCRGFIVTCAGETSGFDYLCRCFAPRAGILEDPVTGSAQCALGPYWKEKLGKDELKACQVSARGGTIRVTPGPERTLLTGQAVTVLRGELV